MIKIFSVLIVSFFMSCGGGGGKTIVVSWNKVNNSCISTSGGYNVYYTTSDEFYASNLNSLDFVQSKVVSYSDLSDPNNPSTTLKVGSGYTYVKITSYCGSTESETSVYTYVLVNWLVG